MYKEILTKDLVNFKTVDVTVIEQVGTGSSVAFSSYLLDGSDHRLFSMGTARYCHQHRNVCDDISDLADGS